MLAHPVPRGYSDHPFGQVVRDVDGVSIKNLRHLVALLREGSGEFLTIRFHGEYREALVLPRKLVEKATPELMAENGIRRRGSGGLMAVWEAKTARRR
jgi:hypothetical protein